MAVFGINIEEKPWYYALGVGLGMAILLAGAVQYVWFRPLNEQIAAKRTELEGLNQEIQKGRAAERKLAQFREEVKRLELELSKLLQILPSKRNTEELIKRIETLTRQGDFTLLKFTPGEFVQKDFYAEWPIDIQIQGTYHNLALFFDRMSRFSRIINVEDLKINALDNVPGKSIAANFIAKTFIYTGDEVGQTTASGGNPPAAAAPAPGKAAPPAARSAQTLKERAEGKGIE
ncbi:MAG TPA: type 4a pilus biogenesis protein PilO [Thermoanaerobaculia bacterium]|nr:type 4a pilus biogenesis protein PilO [Thermoanaerobaculia bacterium]